MESGKNHKTPSRRSSRPPSFVRVCVLIAASILIFTGTFAVMGWGSLLRPLVGGVLYPFQWVLHTVGDGVAGWFRYGADLRGLQEQVDSLQQEKSRLEESLRDAQLIQEENRWLYQYLDMKREHSDYTFCAATVTAAQESSGYATVLTLNKGSAHGVERYMPVVTADGLVGFVFEVGLTHCQVKTILNTDVSVGAVDASGGDRGMVQGRYECLLEGLCMLCYVEETGTLKEGDQVVTSGAGSVYPYGIPIGEIQSVGFNALSRTLEAKIKPYAYKTPLNRVMILTDSNRGLQEGSDSETAAEEETRSSRS